MTISLYINLRILQNIALNQNPWSRLTWKKTPAEYVQTHELEKAIKAGLSPCSLCLAIKATSVRQLL